MARVKAAPKTTTVVYRGDVEALIGRKFEVPLGVSNMRQWIEDNHKPAPKPEPVAEPEVVIEAAPKPAPAPPVTRQMNHAERLDLADAVRESGAAIVGCEERINAKVHDWDQRHEAVVQQNEATAQAAQEQTQTAVETTEQSKAELQQALSEERAETNRLREELTAYVHSGELKGDKGERGKRGVPGAGFGYCDVNPSEVDSESLGQRFFGRAVVSGDHLLRRTKDALLVYRTADGVSWKQVDSIVNKQELVSTKLNVLDQSTKIAGTSISNIIKGGGGGGAGVLPLLTREVRIGVMPYIPICRHYDWDIPSKYWGGDPTASGYEDDDATWERKPYETNSFLVRINAQDVSQVGSYGAASFMVMRHADGRLDVQIHELNTEGRFTEDWVDEFKLVELQEDFTTQSGNKVGIVTGLELQLRFLNKGNPPAFDAVLRGSIFPMIQRRAGI